MTKIQKTGRGQAFSVQGMSKEELISSFAGLEQTELPTKAEIAEYTKEAVDGKRKRRIQMIPNRRKPSQVRGHDLNKRVMAADKLWKKAWAAERGNILRHVGVLYDEEITALSEMTECPQVVVEYFINRGKLA